MFSNPVVIRFAGPRVHPSVAQAARSVRGSVPCSAESRPESSVTRRSRVIARGKLLDPGRGPSGPGRVRPAGCAAGQPNDPAARGNTMHPGSGARQEDRSAGQASMPCEGSASEPRQLSRMITECLRPHRRTDGSRPGRKSLMHRFWRPACRSARLLRGAVDVDGTAERIHSRTTVQAGFSTFQPKAILVVTRVLLHRGPQ